MQNIFLRSYLCTELNSYTTMAKENETIVQQGASANPPAQPTNKERWERNLRAKYPDVQDEDELYGKAMEGYDTEHEYAKQSRQDLQDFAKNINENPQLLAFYQKMQELGADNAEMALLELGDDLISYLTGEIDSDVYQERKRRKAEADAESERAATERREKAKAQRAAMEAWCESEGYDPDEWRERVMQKLLDPISRFSTETALFETLDNMLNYNDDVEQARIQGRNENIVTRRKKAANATDGQLNGGSAAAGAQPKRKASIFDIARDAE